MFDSKLFQKNFITKQGLYNLTTYRYHSTQYTWLDSKMNIFWQKCVLLFPDWFAPNLITFIGWIFVISSYINMLVYDWTFQENIPKNCFLYSSLCVFIYSTLDAIDGKQARRTKSSSPLGQLFDHGCDSLTTSFFILAICQATKLGIREIFIIFIIVQLGLWMSNWMEYNTGIFPTNVGQFGVTQSLYICSIIHLITGIFGQQFWQQQIIITLPTFLIEIIGIESLQLTLGTIYAYFFGSGLISFIFYALLKTLSEKNWNPELIFEFSTLAILLGLQYIWFSYIQIFNQYTGLILLNFGILESLIVCKMIICSVTNMKFEYFHDEIFPTAITTVLLILSNVIFSSVNPSFQKSIQIILFWLMFVVNVGITLSFIYNVISQMTEYLQIYCFSLQKRKYKSG